MTEEIIRRAARIMFTRQYDLIDFLRSISESTNDDTARLADTQENEILERVASALPVIAATAWDDGFMAGNARLTRADNPYRVRVAQD